MFALSTEPEATTEARRILRLCDGLTMNEREQSFAAAVSLLASGNWPAAGRAFNRHSMTYPRDLLALQIGHLIDFYMADSRNLRERIARALADWDQTVPGYSLVLGMYAFGLEETGAYEQAEGYGREAVSREPADCWAHHAVAHVMEMQGRPEDGIGWMIAREPHWSEDANVFKVHNWWHRAVFHLDLGQVDEALALYDGPVREARSTVALDLVDAAALLWRLELVGADVGDRWGELAAAWMTQSDGGTYAFNDWHAAMALLGTGNQPAVGELINRMRAAIESSPTGDWISRYGIPLVEGFSAFRRGDYHAAVEQLLDVRRISSAFGGSHAQRDIIDLTLIEAALRGGERSVARALVNERLAARPTSHMTRQFLHASATGEG
jgi:tetratricopeptide (TPR) repeat protein